MAFIACLTTSYTHGAVRDFVTHVPQLLVSRSTSTTLMMTPQRLRRAPKMLHRERPAIGVGTLEGSSAAPATGAPAATRQSDESADELGELGELGEPVDEHSPEAEKRRQAASLIRRESSSPGEVPGPPPRRPQGELVDANGWDSFMDESMRLQRNGGGSGGDGGFGGGGGARGEEGAQALRVSPVSAEATATGGARGLHPGTATGRSNLARRITVMSWEDMVIAFEEAERQAEQQDAAAVAAAAARPGAGGGATRNSPPPGAKAAKSMRRLYSACISGLASRLRWREAADTLSRALARGLPPTRGRAAEVVSCCGRAGEWEQAVAVLRDMQRHGVAPDGRVYGAAMMACLKAGRPDETLALFEEALASPQALASNRPIASDDALALNTSGDFYSPEAAAFSETSNSSVSLDASNSLKTSSSTPEFLTSSTTLTPSQALASPESMEPPQASASSEALKPSETAAYPEALNSRNGTLGATHCYSSAIRAHGVRGEWRRAVALLEGMEDRGVVPDLECYR